MARLLSRRTFLGAGGVSLLTHAAGIRRRETALLGVIADLHHGLAPTALDRLDVFMEAVGQRRPDAILQLGDFNFATPESEPCMQRWRQFRGPRYHVLGNHDMDFETKRTVVDAWGMPHRYYAFNIGGFRAVVLDRNNLKTESGYLPYSKANFYVDARQRAYVDPAQLSWLKETLEGTSRPVLMFAHQGVGHPRSQSEATREIEQVLERHNRQVGWNQVAACICGHHHIDRFTRKNGIHYLWINSASYYWVGEDYGHMAHYERPLFTFMTLDSGQRLTIERCVSDWASPSPSERGFPGAADLTPFIEGRQLDFGVR